MTHSGKQPIRENHLRHVIEGTNPFPTLTDLDGIVQKMAVEADNTSFVLDQHEQWALKTHLPKCETCQRIYQGLVTLASALQKAIERAVSTTESFI